MFLIFSMPTRVPILGAIVESVLFMVTRSKNVTIRDLVILPNDLDL